MRFVRWRSVALMVLLMAPLAFSAAGTAHAQDATPERVRAAVAQLDSIAMQALERSGVPGLAVAVVYKDEVIYLKGYGVREAGTNAPVDADTVFQLASLSKPLASTVVASVVGEGIVTHETRDSLLELTVAADPNTTFAIDGDRCRRHDFVRTLTADNLAEAATEDDQDDSEAEGEDDDERR